MIWLDDGIPNQNHGLRVIDTHSTFCPTFLLWNMTMFQEEYLAKRKRRMPQKILSGSERNCIRVLLMLHRSPKDRGRGQSEIGPVAIEKGC